MDFRARYEIVDAPPLQERVLLIWLDERDIASRQR